ncbi:MAG: 50S ribosomal protein L4 [Polyangia bacterium]|jgi:large subunit ribosomal protein L4
MQIDVVNMEGQKVGQMELADEVFGCKVREHLLWETVKAQQAARRAGTHSTLTREFVRGGGRKPYRQKGTGNARQGSTRSPNFVGGGKVFGPHPRDYEYTLPRKVKKAALASALSLRAQEKKLIIVERLVVETPKTKRLVAVLKALGLDSAVVVDGKHNGNLAKSVRNLTVCTCLPPEGLNVYDILMRSGLVIAKDVVKEVEARIVGSGAEAAA